MTALVALLLPLTARAGEGIYLDWDQCGPSGSTQQAFPCNANVGSEQLYCAFTLASPIDQVLGVEIVVDVQNAAPALPPWWQLGVDGCRFGALTADGGTPAGSDCIDFWADQQTGGLQGYAVGQPRGGANQARIVVALSLLPAFARTLQPDVLYYAARLVLDNRSTTGDGSCSGCDFDECLVLNSIWIKRTPGAPGGDVFLTTPAPDDGNMVTWHGASANCAAVPVRSTSWGRIKSLYR